MNPGAVLFDAATALALDDTCPAIIPISKNIRGRIHTEPERGHDCPRRCDHPTLGETILSWSLLYKSEWLLNSNTECDQVKTAMLPNHVHGMLTGRGVGPMEDCTICAAYDGYFVFLEGRDLCEPQDVR